MTENARFSTMKQHLYPFFYSKMALVAPSKKLPKTLR